eukprot:COSAG03_NODE_4344_length_1584_cov_60.644444_2_plen_149_part_00
MPVGTELQDRLLPDDAEVGASRPASPTLAAAQHGHGEPGSSDPVRAGGASGDGDGAPLPTVRQEWSWLVQPDSDGALYATTTTVTTAAGAPKMAGSPLRAWMRALGLWRQRRKLEAALDRRRAALLVETRIGCCCCCCFRMDVGQSLL